MGLGAAACAPDSTGGTVPTAQTALASTSTASTTTTPYVTQWSNYVYPTTSGTIPAAVAPATPAVAAPAPVVTTPVVTAPAIDMSKVAIWRGGSPGGDFFMSASQGEEINAGYTVQYAIQFYAAYAPGRVMAFQCWAGHHFVSTSPNCEGNGMDRPLGYVNTVQGPGEIPIWRLRNGTTGFHLIGPDRTESAIYGWSVDIHDGQGNEIPLGYATM